MLVRLLPQPSPTREASGGGAQRPPEVHLWQGVKTLLDDAHEYFTMLGTVKQNLPTWIENLRPLATEHFQNNLIKLLTNDLNALDDEGGSGQESAF